MDNVENLLNALAKLQHIDSELDSILTLRGSLPEEVADLEDDVEGLETRKQKILDDISDLQGQITERKNNIKDYQGRIVKYEEQINEVKNNREYEALQKEIEYANLEILTSEKKIKQYEGHIEQKEVLRDETQDRITERIKDLDAKKEELKKIVEETEKEEKRLEEASNEASVHVDDRILRGYRKIRGSMRNGLAVVTTDRNACGGCFAILPPQLHLDLRQKRKLIMCENCGRILVDVSFFNALREAENA